MVSSLMNTIQCPIMLQLVIRIQLPIPQLGLRRGEEGEGERPPLHQGTMPLILERLS